jgi:predicted lactoylglutathione lyase
VSTTFKTNPVALKELMHHCASGELKLPDFQRGWVWDEDRIIGLLASVSNAYPVGALMTLDNGGEVEFYPRCVEGAPKEAEDKKPSAFLLDGQQRMTSLFQTTSRSEAVLTVTARQKKQKRFYYIDIVKALDPSVARDEAIIGVPETRTVLKGFSKIPVFDVSDTAKEYEQLLFPVNRVFDWDDWQDGFYEHWDAQKEKKDFFKQFKKEVLENFKSYQIPVIALDKNTTREAVCLVFEKVNTGGKPLDAFELVTAMYAANGFRLRTDWETRKSALSEYKALAKVEPVEFLQAITLLHTKALRAAATDENTDLKPVSATRRSILGLPLASYELYADKVQQGYIRAAKFLHGQHIFKALDLPYQTQLVPLAAILAELNNGWDHEGILKPLARWYWCGVLGEQYSSTTESRFAKDVVEVPAWLTGGPEPATVSDATFQEKRLRDMYSRLSAAYKGVNALLLANGARDFLSGQKITAKFFFDESIDIHHIFPRDWCEKNNIKWTVFDSIINKTPLTARTNRILGGIAPSRYITRLQNGWESAPTIDPADLDTYLASHGINTPALRRDDFDAFMDDRRRMLLALVEAAMGKPAVRESQDVQDDGVPDLDGELAELTAAGE